MRISGEHIYNISQKLIEQVQRKRADGPVSTQRASQARPDEAVLSPQAKDIRVALQAVHDVPQARRQRVEELARKVCEGTFKPSSDAIADAMLREISAEESL